VIQVTHLTYKRKYKVIGMSKEPATRVTFDYKKTDPRGMSVRELALSVWIQLKCIFALNHRQRN
jgi:hypothetical protein